MTISENISLRQKIHSVCAYNVQKNHNMKFQKRLKKKYKKLVSRNGQIYELIKIFYFLKFNIILCVRQSKNIVGNLFF